MSCLYSELKEIICKNSSHDMTIEDVNQAKDLIEDFGYNSINLILLLMEIENKWNIIFDENKIQMSKLSNINYLFETTSKLVELKKEEI